MNVNKDLLLHDIVSSISCSQCSGGVSELVSRLRSELRLAFRSEKVLGVLLSGFACGTIFMLRSVYHARNLSPTFSSRSDSSFEKAPPFSLRRIRKG